MKLNKIMETLLIRSAILIAFFLFFILAIELHHWYKFAIKLPPNDNRTITWGHKVKNNKWGFREKDFDALTLSQPDRFVILVLGDSLTWGVGLEDNERYTYLLEELLQQEYQDKQVTVLNFAVTGGATIKERDIMLSVYKQIKPKVVIIGFCFNDPIEREHDYSREKEFYFSKINPILLFLSRHKMPASAQLLALAYENFLILLKKIPDWEDISNAAYNEESSQWGEFANALKDIVTMTKEVTPHPPIFISLNQGTSYSVPTDYCNPDAELKQILLWYHQAEAAARQAGFITVNCEEELKKLKKHIMAVIKGADGHPSMEMNKIYAEKLFSVIKTHKFIKN